jgi:hypothetical protein
MPVPLFRHHHFFFTGSFCLLRSAEAVTPPRVAALQQSRDTILAPKIMLTPKFTYLRAIHDQAL